MFEKVSKSRATFGFHSKADVVINSDRDHRCDMVFGDYNLQAVRKFVVNERDVDGLGWRDSACGNARGNDYESNSY